MENADFCLSVLGCGLMYLGERPPWEQVEGEVSGLLWLLACPGGIFPATFKTARHHLTVKHPAVTLIGEAWF